MYASSSYSPSDMQRYVTPNTAFAFARLAAGRTKHKTIHFFSEDNVTANGYAMHDIIRHIPSHVKDMFDKVGRTRMVTGSKGDDDLDVSFIVAWLMTYQAVGFKEVMNSEEMKSIILGSTLNFDNSHQFTLSSSPTDSELKTLVRRATHYDGVQGNVGAVIAALESKGIFLDMGDADTVFIHKEQNALYTEDVSRGNAPASLAWPLFIAHVSDIIRQDATVSDLVSPVTSGAKSLMQNKIGDKSRFSISNRPDPAKKQPYPVNDFVQKGDGEGGSNYE
jgi:hypothetical protein